VELSIIVFFFSQKVLTLTPVTEFDGTPVRHCGLYLYIDEGKCKKLFTVSCYCDFLPNVTVYARCRRYVHMQFKYTAHAYKTRVLMIIIERHY